MGASWNEHALFRDQHQTTSLGVWFTPSYQKNMGDNRPRENSLNGNNEQLEGVVPNK